MLYGYAILSSSINHLMDFGVIYTFGGTSLVAQRLKHLPGMRETLVQSLGWGDPLEEGMTTHSSILAWRLPMDRGAWRATTHGVAKSRT